MLAEMFMVQLEAAARASLPKDMLPSSNSQFVPFVTGGQFEFKDRAKGTVEMPRDVTRSVLAD